MYICIDIIIVHNRNVFAKFYVYYTLRVQSCMHSQPYGRERVKYLTNMHHDCVMAICGRQCDTAGSMQPHILRILTPRLIPSSHSLMCSQFNSHIHISSFNTPRIYARRLAWRHTRRHICIILPRLRPLCALQNSILLWFLNRLNSSSGYYFIL